MPTNTYTLSFADSVKHVPEHPERTANRSISWDVSYRVFKTRDAMLSLLQKQGKRASHYTDWKAVQA